MILTRMLTDTTRAHAFSWFAREQDAHGVDVLRDVPRGGGGVVDERGTRIYVWAVRTHG